MTTPFGSFLTTADASIFSTFGQSATYNDPDGGAAAAVTVVLGDVAAATETDDLGRRLYQTGVCHVSLTDIAAPDAAVGGTLTVDTAVWTISRVIDHDETAAQYEIWRDDDNRRHRETQYRRTV